jgi:protein-tyrosine phosphatase
MSEFFMTDIHCHILPGVDDGAKDWNATLEMCRIAYADGIRHIVATPHANYRYTYDRVRYSDLLAELQERVPEIQFSLGCDFHLSHDNIQDAIKYPDRYVIGETLYLLVEFSDFQTPHQMAESLFTLHCAGFRTIVTHPERNPIIDQYPDLPAQFFDLGASLQITAGSLTGHWGRKAKKTSETLLKKDLVAFIASDAHEAHRRTPVLAVACKVAARLAGDPQARILVQDNPAAILVKQPRLEELFTGL